MLDDWLDKDEVKARLPLAYACFRLGINLTTSGEALCPFHADTSPSFHLYVGDDGIERWGCFPCKEGGDVFDLIQRAQGVGFTESVEIAQGWLAEKPEDYVPPTIATAARLGPDDWEQDVHAARRRAKDPRFLGALSRWHGLCDPTDEGLGQVFDRMLRDELGWGIEETGAAVMPHWKKDGADGRMVMTGCKIRRPDGRRLSKEGSKYDALYGDWMGKQHRNVAITEGETDMAWLMWNARYEAVQLDVRALPRGAGADVTGEQVAQLAPWARGTVYLVLDPDDAGVEATRQWAEALADAGFADVRLCRLPRGRDIRDARPKVSTLLANARSPLSQPAAIGATPEGYFVTNKEGEPRSISKWIIEPKAALTGGEDGPGLEIDLISRKLIEDDVIRWSDVVSSFALKKWCAARSLTFQGNERDLVKVVEHLQWRASFVPEIFQTDHVGYHAPPAQYGFAGPSVVYPEGQIGDLPFLFAPGPKKADVRGSVLLKQAVEDIDHGEGFDWMWLRAFLALTDPSVTHTMLSWVCAASRRPEVGNFPMLFVGGPSGVGKSTLSQLTCRLMGSRISAPLGSVTPYILMQRLASTSSLPVFVDEWTRLSRKDTREQMQGLVPVIYEGGLAERGQSDLNVVRYRVNAPTLIAGEDTLHLDRELERIVGVMPRHGWQNKQALAAIATAPIERFGALFHKFIAENHGALAPLVEGHPATRPEYNRAILEGGWRTLHAFLDSARMQDESVPEIPLEGTYHSAEDDGLARAENVYETAVREAASYRDKGHLPYSWPDDMERGTWFRPSVIVPFIEKELDIELPGRSRAMLDYFRGRYGVTEGTVRPDEGTKQVRAYLIKGFQITPE